MLKNSISDGPEVESEESLPHRKKSFWRKVPFIGLILILVKNILAGISDLVIKKMTDIDPITLIFFRSTVMLSLEIPWSIVKDQPPFPSGLSIKERGLQVMRFSIILFTAIFDNIIVEIFFKRPKLINFLSPLSLMLELFRCILAGFHVLAAYWALKQMPLSVQKMILSLKPVFTIIFERIFLKVPIGVVEVKLNDEMKLYKSYLFVSFFRFLQLS